MRQGLGVFFCGERRGVWSYCVLKLGLLLASAATETKVESGTSQCKRGTSVTLSNGGVLQVCSLAVGNDADDVICVVFSPDSKRLVTGNYCYVRIWDAATGAEVRCGVFLRFFPEAEVWWLWGAGTGVLLVWELDAGVHGVNALGVRILGPAGMNRGSCRQSGVGLDCLLKATWRRGVPPR